MNTLRLALLIGSAALAAAPAQAYVYERIDVRIPFRFDVGGQSFAPGDYVIQPISAASPSAIEIRKADDSARTIVLTRSAQRGTATDDPQLVFARQGRRRALRAIYEGGSATGAELDVTAVPPKRLAHAAPAPKKVAVAAPRRPLPCTCVTPSAASGAKKTVSTAQPKAPTKTASR